MEHDLQTFVFPSSLRGITIMASMYQDVTTISLQDGRCNHYEMREG